MNALIDWLKDVPGTVWVAALSAAALITTTLLQIRASNRREDKTRCHTERELSTASFWSPLVAK